MSDYTNGHQPRLANHALPVIEESDHDKMRELLRPGLGNFAKRMLEGIAVSPPDRTAMNLYPRIMKMIGADVEINVAIVLQRELGVGLSEAKRMLAMVQSVDGISYDDAMTSAEIALREFYAAKGYRLMVVKEDEAVA